MSVEEVLTLAVVAVKRALVAPAGTVTLAGTVTTPALLLESEMSAPPLGAGPLRVTRPEDGDPPTILLGVNTMEVTVGPAAGCGVTVREALRGSPELEAEMVTVVVLVEIEVVTWNAAALAPAGTVTLDGTVATEALLLDRESVRPPLGAGLSSIICPVDEFPPFTLLGFKARENEVAAF